MKKAYEGNKEYIFISYSHSDIDIVKPFILELQSRYNVWYDEGIEPGVDYKDTIMERIDRCSIFFFLITKNSIMSNFCLKEIRYAEKKNKKFINIQIEDFILPDKFDFDYGHIQMCLVYKFKDAAEAIDDLERKCHWLKGIRLEPAKDTFLEQQFLRKEIQIETIKTELGIDFYNDLVKCDFLIDLVEMLNKDSLINIDFSDILSISRNSRITGALSQMFKNNFIDSGELCIDTINDLVPTDCIVLITSGYNISLQTVDKIISVIRDKYNGINVIFGTCINEYINKKIKVQALFTCPKEEITTPKEIHEEEATNTEEFHKDLLYNIYLYMFDNEISVNSIQEHFFLGFNKALRIISELEDLGIISKKTGTNKRTILIKDDIEAKKLIYKNK